MSFRLKIILGIIVIQALLLVILISISLNFLRLSNEIELSKRATTVATLFAVALRDPVRNRNYEGMLAEARVIVSQPGILYARIFSGDQQAEAGNVLLLDRPFADDFMTDEVDDGVFDTYASVTESDGTFLGRVEIGLSVAEIKDVMEAAQRQISTIAIIGMGFSILMSIFLGNYFARQLKSLRDAARSIASGNMGYQIFMKGEDELAQTANAFNTMSRKLALLYSEKQAALNDAEDQAVGSREKERRINAILENAGDGIITIDAKGDIESFNSTAEKMFGYSEQEVVGENIKLLMNDHDQQQHDNYLADYLKTGEKHLMVAAREVVGRRKDGDTFSMELDVSEMILEGQRLFIGIARDITDRKLAEEQLFMAQQATLDAARSKFDFIANISHEIRSPMNGVLSMINLLEESKLNKEQREYTHQIHNSSSALITIVNDILDFSRLEAGHMELEQVEFDLEQTIEGVCRLLSSNAAERGLELTYLINANVSTAIVGDPARVRQLLVNLVENAIKFTTQGGVTIKLEQLVENETDVGITFSIEDTGIGISPRIQRNILEGSGEAVSSQGDPSKGSIGLGLAIVRKLVMLMGGEIELESEVGVGTTFSFTLWLTKQDEKDAAQGLQNELVNLKVLVIDNRDVWSEFINEQLATYQMQTTLAADPERGLEALRQATDQDQPFDLVIFDMMLPDCSGLDLAKNIRADHHIAALRMIMIATTGYRGDSEEVRKVGISGYLSTPISQNQLYECIVAVMNLAEEDRSLITRHSLADSRSSKRNHVLMVLQDEVEIRHLSYLMQKIKASAHYIVDTNRLASVIGRHHYGCILIDCRGLTPAASRRHLDELIDSVDANHDIHIIALIESADEHLRQEYHAVGMDSLLCWPVKSNELKTVIMASNEDLLY